MTHLDLEAVLSGKWQDGTRPKDLYARHIANHAEEHVDDIISALGSKSRRVQGGAAELASLLSEHHPRLLLPHVGLFLANLNAKAPILRWEAVCTVGNLAHLDDPQRIRKHITDITSNLSHESIVLQGHSVRALVKIAAAWPEEAASILAALVAAEQHFPGNRIGYLVEAMGGFAGHGDLVADAKQFAERYTSSDIKSVAAKARKARKVLGG